MKKRDVVLLTVLGLVCMCGMAFGTNLNPPVPESDYLTMLVTGVMGFGYLRYRLSK